MKTTLNVKKMHCKSCEMLIQDAIEDLGAKASASHEKGKVDIEFDENKVSIDQIKKAIKDEGYDVQ